MFFFSFRKTDNADWQGVSETDAMDNDFEIKSEISSKNLKNKSIIAGYTAILKSDFWNKVDSSGNYNWENILQYCLSLLSSYLSIVFNVTQNFIHGFAINVC